MEINPRDLKGWSEAKIWPPNSSKFRYRSESRDSLDFQFEFPCEDVIQDLIPLQESAHLLLRHPFPQLQELRFAATGIEDIHLSSISKAIMLGNLPRLRVLDLRENEISASSFDVLAEALMSVELSSLHDLHLGKTSLREREMLKVASLLEDGHLPRLRFLDLRNGIGSSTVQQAFLRAYRNNATLVVELDIQLPKYFYSQIEKVFERNIAVRHLAVALASGLLPRLKRLSLFLQTPLPHRVSLSEEVTVSMGQTAPADNMEFCRERNMAVHPLAMALTPRLLPGLNRLPFGEMPGPDRVSLSQEARVSTGLMAPTKNVEEIVRAWESGSVTLEEELALSHFALGDESVTVILRALKAEQVPALEKLCVVQNLMGTKGAIAVAEVLQSSEWSSLLELDLSGNRNIGEEGRRALCGALRSGQTSQLEQLNLGNTALGEENMLEIASLLEAGHLPHLRSLNLSGGIPSLTVEEALVRAYANNRALIVELRRQWARPFCKTEVEHLRERNIKLSTVVSTAIELGLVPGLKRLSLGREVREGGLEHVNELVALWERGGRVTINNVDELISAWEAGEVTALQELWLSNFAIRSEGIRAITRALESGRVLALEKLSCARNSLRREGAVEIAKALKSSHLSSLIELDLSHNPHIGGDARQALLEALKSFHMCNLQHLCLENMSFHEQDMLKIVDLLECGNLPGLRSLHLRENIISRQVESGIIGAYRKNVSLVAEVDVDWTTSSNDTVRELRGRNRVVRALGTALGLGLLPKLKRLWIGKTVGENVSQEISETNVDEFVHTSNSEQVTLLEHLVLPGFAVGDEGVKVILMGLEQRGVKLDLETLSLASNSIGDVGAYAIAKAIHASHLTSLMRLDLSNNPLIADDGIHALLEGLKSNQLHNLQELNLKNSIPYDRHVVEIAEILESGHLPNLKSLNLQIDHVSSTIEDAILMAYHRNTSLVVKINMHWPASSTKVLAMDFWQRNMTVAALKIASESGLLSGLKSLTFGKKIRDQVWESMAGSVDELLKVWESMGGAPLEDLILNEFNLEDESVQMIFEVLGSGQFSALEKFCLAQTSIGENGAKAVASALHSSHLSTMLELDISFDSQIGQEGTLALLQALKSSSMSNLKVLHLENTSFGKDNVVTIAGFLEDGYLPQLCVLHVPHEIIDRIVDNAFHSAFRRNVSLVVEIHMQWSSSASQQAVEELRRRNMALSWLLPSLESGLLPELKRLSLGKGQLITTNVDDLVRKLKSGPVTYWMEVALTGFDLEDEGVTMILRTLEAGHVLALENLSLAQNSIGEVGAIAISKAMHSSYFSSLTKFDLSHNRGIADGGRMALCAALKSGRVHCLEELYLQNISLREQDMLEIAYLLEAGHLPHLKQLNLHGNGVSQNSAKSFVNAYHKNTFLVAEISLQWPNWLTKNNAEGFRKRNLRLASALKVLQNEGDDSGTHGKIYLCGHPNTGKTTLRLSLMRKKWKALLTNERRLSTEERTRGIEVSHIVNKNRQESSPLMLSVWDLAGQEEYHLLHSAFLPDLAFAEGQATIFVVVCSANHSKTSNFLSAADELLYWMKFISSSSVKGIKELKRQVFVVLNCFDGDQSRHRLDEWTALLHDYSERFAAYLNIHGEPFILDVRYASKVKLLKQKLASKAKELLQNRPMPRICLKVQESCKDWSEKNATYPILKWQEFSSKLFNGLISHERLIAATEYLHEAGHLIYLREGALKEGGLPDEVLVILDPEWFCRKVVGDLLLPMHMLRSDETHLRSRMDPDGSLPIAALKQHFPE